MPNKVSPIPQGFHTVTAALTVHDAAKALEFYAKAFGAKERNRNQGPGGKIWHSEIEIGDSIVMVSDEFPEMGSKSAKSLGGTAVGLWVYVPDVDAMYHMAIKAGAQKLREPTTEFWGDRMAALMDPFGHRWTIATHVEDPTPSEIDRRRIEAMKRFGGGGS